MQRAQVNAKHARKANRGSFQWQGTSRVLFKQSNALVKPLLTISGLALKPLGHSVKLLCNLSHKLLKTLWLKQQIAIQSFSTVSSKFKQSSNDSSFFFVSKIVNTIAELADNALNSSHNQHMMEDLIVGIQFTVQLQ